VIEFRGVDKWFGTLPGGTKPTVVTVPGGPAEVIFTTL